MRVCSHHSVQCAFNPDTFSFSSRGLWVQHNSAQDYVEMLQHCQKTNYKNVCVRACVCARVCKAVANSTRSGQVANGNLQSNKRCHDKQKSRTLTERRALSPWQQPETTKEPGTKEGREEGENGRKRKEGYRQTGREGLKWKRTKIQESVLLP